ncbi:MAG: geranylgeranyl diphosphate synthase type II [Saprospiraceae bacterium]|jgi:geranylgeranyl diphosphate synthase type II
MPLNISQAQELLASHNTNNFINAEPRGLYDPRDYIMSMAGKKLRSLFCLLGYQLYKEDISKALDAAYCIELFHNFSLVHDDIMDEAELRRGQPSVHVKYSSNAAILSGDVMLIEVYQRLAKLEVVDKVHVIELFSKVAREVCEGQSMDMAFETLDQVSIEEYLEMIRLKTAVLLGLSVRVGALMAGASESDQEHLNQFATNAGVAFQLQDDYLDVYGDPEKFGKKVGGDIIQGKKTYLYLRAVQLLSEKERNEFIEFYISADEQPFAKVERVRSIFDELYIPHYCEEAKTAFFDLAKSHLDVVNLPEDKKEELKEFALTLMNRNS